MDKSFSVYLSSWSTTFPVALSNPDTIKTDVIFARSQCAKQYFVIEKRRGWKPVRIMTLFTALHLFTSQLNLKFCSLLEITVLDIFYTSSSPLWSSSQTVLIDFTRSCIRSKMHCAHWKANLCSHCSSQVFTDRNVHRLSVTLSQTRANWF